MIRAVSFAAVAHALGIDQRPRSWQRKHLSHLMAQHGFPPPLPHRLARAGHGSLYWDPRAVDHWFDQLAGGAATAAAEQAGIDAAAALLDRRAAGFSSATG